MTAEMQARYDIDSPGPYCLNHRSVFCMDAQYVIAERWDTDHLAEVIGGHIGQEFMVSFPIYPAFCIWETIGYAGINHEMLGPMAEMTGRGAPRHKMVQRLLPGESASDLAQSLRDLYEAEVEDRVEGLRKRPARSVAGTGTSLPRCASPGHSMRYQRLLNEMWDVKLLNEQWDDVRDQTYASLWTIHYYKMCLFCWTKANMADAIRVSPDFAPEAGSGEPENHDDLIPDSSDTNKRSSSSSTPGPIPW